MSTYRLVALCHFDGYSMYIVYVQGRSSGRVCTGSIWKQTEGAGGSPPRRSGGYMVVDVDIAIDVVDR